MIQAHWPLSNPNLTGRRVTPPPSPPILPPTSHWCLVLQFWSIKNFPGSLEFRPPSLPPYYSLCGKMRQGGRRAPEPRGRGLAEGGPFPRPRRPGGSFLQLQQLQIQRHGPWRTPLEAGSPDTARGRRLTPQGLSCRLRPSSPALPALVPQDCCEGRHRNYTGQPTRTSTVSSAQGPVL